MNCIKSPLGGLGVIKPLPINALIPEVLQCTLPEII
jgi:hypothetical protein